MRRFLLLVLVSMMATGLPALAQSAGGPPSTSDAPLLSNGPLPPAPAAGAELPPGALPTVVWPPPPPTGQAPAPGTTVPEFNPPPIGSMGLPLATAPAPLVPTPAGYGAAGVVLTPPPAPVAPPPASVQAPKPPVGLQPAAPQPTAPVPGPLSAPVLPPTQMVPQPANVQLPPAPPLNGPPTFNPPQAASPLVQMPLPTMPVPPAPTAPAAPGTAGSRGTQGTPPGVWVEMPPLPPLSGSAPAPGKASLPIISAYMGVELHHLSHSLNSIRELVQEPQSEGALRRLLDLGRFSGKILNLGRFPHLPRLQVRTDANVLRNRSFGSWEYRNLGLFDTRLNGWIKPAPNRIHTDLTFRGHGRQIVTIKAELSDTGPLDGSLAIQAADEWGRPYRLRIEFRGLLLRDDGLPSAGILQMAGVDTANRSQGIRLDFPVQEIVPPPRKRR